MQPDIQIRERERVPLLLVSLEQFTTAINSGLSPSNSTHDIEGTRIDTSKPRWQNSNFTLIHLMYMNKMRDSAAPSV